MLALSRDAQPRVRAPRGRHANAPARPHLRRRLHPRRDLVPDDGGRPRAGDRDRRAPRAAGRRRHPHAGRDDARSSSRRPTTAATTATTAAASATSSGRMPRIRPTRRRTSSTTRSSRAGPVTSSAVVHDRHTLGALPGGDLEAPAHGGRPRARRHDGPEPVRARASGLRRTPRRPLDAVRKDLYSRCRTYVRPPDHWRARC